MTPRKVEPERAFEQPQRRMGFNRVQGDALPARPITLPATPWPTTWPQRQWDAEA